MTKQDIIKKVAAETGQSAAAVREVLEASLSAITDSVSNGQAVFLRGFGTFTQKHRAEKKARNIGRGTEIIVAAHDIAYFKPCRAFKIRKQLVSTRKK